MKISNEKLVSKEMFVRRGGGGGRSPVPKKNICAYRVSAGEEDVVF